MNGRAALAWLWIVALGAGAAMAYGIIQDQVAVRVSGEYFTIGHVPLFDTTSPTLLALGWGVADTWWLALPFGVLLAAAARAGARRALGAGELLRPVGLLFAMIALAAALAGALGYVLARNGVLDVPQDFVDLLPAERQQLFMADWWAHNASCAVGVLGGIVLCLRLYRERARKAVLSARRAAGK
ncbi:MAG TPA: hypothetical protein VFA60_10205 [Terriglobales bacterium]|nr:hypothetical protein [Terriglobales bacterium]